MIWSCMGTAATHTAYYFWIKCSKVYSVLHWLPAAVFLMCNEVKMRRMFKLPSKRASTLRWTGGQCGAMLHEYFCRKCITSVLDLLALSLSHQQYSSFLLLQPSSVETLVRLPKDGEKGAVSSSSLRWHLAAMPPMCWWDQQHACAKRMAPGADLSLDV